MNIKKWIIENTSSLQVKTIAITGSTGVISKHLVETLAGLDANLILINRNKEKTLSQMKKLNLMYPNVKLEFIQCDLANFESVCFAIEKLKEKQIDVLFLSAGAYNIKRFKTSLGYDNIFQTNFLSHYFIAKELLDKIKQRNGKIVAVSSIAHNYSKIDLKDIDFSTRKKHSKVYGNAKRFLMFSLQELAKKEDVNLSIVHPGLTLTEMTNHYPKAINWLVKCVIGLFCPTNKKASLNLVKGVFEKTEHYEWIGPKILNIWGNPKKQKLKTCTKEECEQIFKVAEKIYNDIKK